MTFCSPSKVSLELTHSHSGRFDLRNLIKAKEKHSLELKQKDAFKNIEAKVAKEIEDEENNLH